jgi:hypothetical protein
MLQRFVLLGHHRFFYVTVFRGVHVADAAAVG